MRNIVLVNPFDKIPGEKFRDQRYTFIYYLLRDNYRVLWISSDYHHWTHRKRDIEKIPPQDRMNIVLVPMHEYRHNLSLVRMGSYFVYSIRVMQRIAKISPTADLILCMAPVELMFMLAIYAKIKKIDYVIDILDIWPDLFVRAFPSKLRWLAYGLLSPYYLMSFLTCRLADHITSVSKTYTSWAMKRGGRDDISNSSYYYLGCVTGCLSYNHSKPRTRLRCLFAGQFGFNYDIETIIESIKIIKEISSDEIEFILAGDGYKLPTVKKAAQHLSNVEFLGWVSSEKLQQVAQTCHVGLCCYIKGATQSMPTKLFDYMSLGLFILNSIPGEASEFIEKENIGISYQAGNPRDMAMALVSLASKIDTVIETGYRSWLLSQERYKAENIYKRMVSELLAKPIINLNRPGL